MCVSSVKYTTHNVLSVWYSTYCPLDTQSIVRQMLDIPTQYSQLSLELVLSSYYPTQFTVAVGWTHVGREENLFYLRRFWITELSHNCPLHIITVMCITSYSICIVLLLRYVSIYDTMAPMSLAPWMNIQITRRKPLGIKPRVGTKNAN